MTGFIILIIYWPIVRTAQSWAFQGKTKGFTEPGKPSMVGRGGNKPSENFQSLKPNKIKVSSFISIYKTDSLRQIYDSYLHEKELNIKSAGLPSRFFIKFV